METEHRLFIDDSRSLDQVGENDVEMIVTSPPYPMIELWDDLFGDLNPRIATNLEAGNGDDAFELMHEELDKVWEGINRVLVPGGIACINIGDATRKVEDSFKVYQNHSRIINTFKELGFHPLPDILWRKPTNSAAKFMGSGMLPPNAYVTLEHEFILVFRNGGTRRDFQSGSKQRYESAYFWEERNDWFSDIWMNIRGELQELNNNELRNRSAAFPLEIPYRLINMYSVYGDTVLDPFWGTGTTSLAAMIAGRNSIGYEIEHEFAQVFDERASKAPQMADTVIGKRLQRHQDFVETRLETGKELKYESEVYGFPVMTKQEKQLQFYGITDVAKQDDGYVVEHTPFTETGQQRLDAVAQDEESSQSTLGSDFR